MIVDNPEVFTGKIGKTKTNEVSLMIDGNVMHTSCTETEANTIQSLGLGRKGHPRPP